MGLTVKIKRAIDFHYRYRFSEKEMGYKKGIRNKTVKVNKRILAIWKQGNWNKLMHFK